VQVNLELELELGGGYSMTTERGLMKGKDAQPNHLVGNYNILGGLISHHPSKGSPLRSEVVSIRFDSKKVAL
jgi:hypothetical protein